MSSKLKKADRELFARLYDSGKLPAILRGLGVFLKDYSSGACIPNTLWTDLGYSADDLRADRWRELLHPEDRDRVLEEWDRVYSGGADAWSGEYRIRNSAGQWRVIKHRTLVLERDDQGVPSLTVGVDQEISELRDELEEERAARSRAESQLADAELLRTAGTLASSNLDAVEAIDSVLAQARSILSFEAALVWTPKNDSLVCVRSSGIDPIASIGQEALPLRAANERRPIAVTGVAAAGVAGVAVAGLAAAGAAPPGDMDGYGAYKARARLCLPLILRNRVLAVLEFLSRDAHAFEGQSVRRALSFSDSAAIALANSLRFTASEQLAGTDWLTGLGTRRRLEERGLIVLAEPRECTSCLMIDIDRFKQVNDEFGHQAGDAVLRELGQLCRKILRDGDVVCRYGGEEIAAILPGACEKAAVEAAERIRSAVEFCRIPDYPELRISVSVGVYATKVDAAKAAAELSRIIACADSAVYRAKQTGRNRVVLEA
jgi:diguanylate cyclase (GGDEF)-like protein